MTYCTQCRAKLPEDAKFCPECGVAVSGSSENGGRKQKFTGEIHKCPNCGERLKSFTSVCPACGLELRGSETSKNLKEFVAKLETSIDLQRVSLIKTFPIPNNKEDILEFMILAISNVNPSIYGITGIFKQSFNEKALSDAWNAKVKQAYTKAKNSLSSDEDIQQIQELYDEYVTSIRKQKRSKRAIIIAIPAVWLSIVLFAILLLLPSLFRDTVTTTLQEVEVNGMTISEACQAVRAAGWGIYEVNGVSQYGSKYGISDCSDKSHKVIKAIFHTEYKTSSEKERYEKVTLEYDYFD